MATIRLTIRDDFLTEEQMSPWLMGVPVIYDTDDVIYGAAGADTIGGALGAYTLIGGDGDDLLSGGAGSDLLLGGAGADTLGAGRGQDRLLGGAGDDVLVMPRQRNGSARLDGGEGWDRLDIGGALTLGRHADLTRGVLWEKRDGLPDLRLARIVPDRATGFSSIEALRGDAAADTLSGDTRGNSLDGGQGNDLLRGRDGDDTLVASPGADTLDGGRGFDLVELGAATQLLFQGGIASLAEGLARIGIGPASLLFGIEHLRGGTYADTLEGGAGRGMIEGGAGRDLLRGGRGDTLDGGAGADTYGLLAPGAVVVDSGTDGARDRIEAGYVMRLPDGIEDLHLLAGVLRGFGNGGDNRLVGNDEANLLRGEAGADTLEGGAGADTLVGGAGDDSLWGGAGADLLVGGAGDDRYVVDHASDRIVEDGLGHSRVTASLDWRLGAKLDDLVLTGTATSGIGNARANLIEASAWADVSLFGLDGADTLRGSRGSDLLDGGDGNDLLEGGPGGGFLSFPAPPVGDDTLRGGAGADTLDGGGGDNLLIGGLGPDLFRFTVFGGQDRVQDFDPAEGDAIAIARSRLALFRVIGDPPFGAEQLEDGSLDDQPEHFAANATGLATTPGTAQFTYQTTTGQLWWDEDGMAGGALLIATFAGAPAITAAEITIIA